MTLEICTYPNDVLAQKAEDISEISDEIKSLAGAMAETMYSNDGIGLAAPQVGRSIRLIVVDISGPSERTDLMVLLNPRIVHQEGETCTEEGCLSVVSFRSNVTRYNNVIVEALDLSGNEVRIEAEGLLAICLQHEIDHLNGVLFIDRISRLKRNIYDKKLKKWIKQASAQE